MTAEEVNRTLRQMILTLSRRVAVLESGGGGSSYTDEQAQDAVGGILDPTATITPTYVDATPSITFDVNDGSITYDKIQDAVDVPCVIGADAVGPLREIDIGNGLALDGSPPVLRVTSVPAGGGGGLVLLEERTASSSATLDLTTRNVSGQSGATIQSDYDEYIIEIIGLLPATDAVNLRMTVSTNGGSSFSNSGYAYGLWSVASHGATSAGASSVSDSSFNLGGTVENTTSASFGVDATIKAFNPGSSTRIKGFGIDSNFTGSDANYYNWHGVADWASTSAINAFRFAFSSGNIAEGKIRIYGLAKS